MHMVSFLHQGVPKQTFLFISGNGHANRCRVSFRKLFQGYIIFHGFVILSHPFHRCFQKPHTICRLPLQLDQFCLLVQQMLHQLRIVIRTQQHFPNVGQTKAHILQGSNPIGNRKLILTVIPIAGKRVNLCRLQQTDLIIMAQHTNADSGQLGKISDF